MADFCTLSNRVWHGDTNYPVAYYYADSAKTVTIRLLDVSTGQVVLETTRDLTQGTNYIGIGSWLYTEYQSSPIAEGFYVLQIGEFQYPFIVATKSGALSIGEEDIPQDKIKKIIVYDDTTGFYTQLPPSELLAPVGRFMTFIYLHDDDRKLGRLVIYTGNVSKVDTGWARNAIVEVKISFNSIDDLAAYLAKYIAENDYVTADTLGKILNSSRIDFARIARMFHLTTPFGDLVDWWIDPDTFTVTMKIVVRVGWGWDSVWRALRYVVAGAVAGAGVMAGIAITMNTGGLGAFVGAAVAGASIGLAYSIVASSNDRDWAQKIENAASQGVGNVSTAANEAISTLDYYKNAGQVSEDAYNAIKAKIVAIRDTAVQAIKEVAEAAKECYNAGYNDCKSKYTKYVVGAGAGGLVLGLAVRR